MSEPASRSSTLQALFWLLRLNRSIMIATITGAGAFAAGAGAARALGMALAGWCLAVGGLSLDMYADRDLDMQGPRAKTRHNPLADGSLSPAAGLAFSIAFIVASFALTLALAPRALLAWGAIMAVILGLALHRFETPLARALTLGLLQALYMAMGGLAGRLSLGVGILAAMFFFAMLGGRGMTDIRDFSQDEVTRVQTLPKRYGVQRTARFTALCLLIAYALSLAAYLTGEFGAMYLVLDLVFITVGIVCAWLFVARPTPALARTLTLVFMMGEGMLISLAIVLGKL